MADISVFPVFVNLQRPQLSIHIMKGQMMWLLLLFTVVQLLQAAPLEESTTVKTVRPLASRQIFEEESQEIPVEDETSNEDSDNDDNGTDISYDDRKKRSDESYSRSLIENSRSVEDLKTKVKRETGEGKNLESLIGDGSSEEFGETLPLVRSKRRALDKSLESKESKQVSDDSSNGVTKKKIVRSLVENSASIEDLKTKVKRETGKGKNLHSVLDDGSSEEFGETLPLVRSKRHPLDKSLESKESKQVADDLTNKKTVRSLVENSASVEDLKTKVKRETGKGKNLLSVIDDGSSEELFGETLPLVRSKRGSYEDSRSDDKFDDSDESGDISDRRKRRGSEEDRSSNERYDKFDNRDESDDVSDKKKRKRRGSEEDSRSDDRHDEFDNSDESDDISDKRKRRQNTPGTTTTTRATPTTSATTTTPTTEADVPLIVVAPSNVPVKQISSAIKQDLQNLKKSLDNFHNKVENDESALTSVGILAGKETSKDKDTVIHTISSAEYIVH